MEVILVSGIPQLKTNPDRCVQWFQSGRHECDIERILGVNSNINKRNE